MAASASILPAFIAEECSHYLRCGILSHGCIAISRVNSNLLQFALDDQGHGGYRGASSGPRLAIGARAPMGLHATQVAAVSVGLATQADKPCAAAILARPPSEASSPSRGLLVCDL